MPTAFDRTQPQQDHSPLANLLDFSEITQTTDFFGGLIKQLLDNLPQLVLDAVVGFIKDTTGIDLSGFSELFTGIFDEIGLDLPGLADLNPISLFSDLLGFIPGLGTGSPDAAGFITDILSPTGLLASITSIVEALTGSAGDLTDLTAWATDIPILGDLVAAITGSTGGLTDLTSFFTDFFGIFGGATGLGQAGNFFTNLLSFLGTPTLTGSTGSFDPTAAATSFINDILNPTGLLASLSSILDLFGGSTTLTQGQNFFTNFLSLFGTPTLTGSPGSFNPTTVLGGIPFGIPNTSIIGLNGVGDLGGTVQDLIDVGVQALLGGIGTGYSLPDWQDALLNIPAFNVLGAGGMPNMGSTITTMWDEITSAFRLSGLTGVSLSDFAAAAQNTSQSATSAFSLSAGQENILGIRTNRPVMGALERTTVSNFLLSQLGTAATPTNFGVTQAASSIAFLRMPELDTKGVLYWYGSGNASITGFYLNFGKMALDGTVTPLFSSANLVGQLTSGWGWQSYTFPGPNKIVHGASENIVVEFQVVGAGTHSVAGLPMAWMTNHPVATTKRAAATRNNGASGPTSLSIASASVAFSGNTPWIGLGRSDVPVDYIPPQVDQFVASGTYTRPAWLVAGDIIDVFVLASGGGGQAGGYGLPGQGGEAGTWQTRSLVIGADIPLGTTNLSVVINNAGAGGVNPFVLQPGDNGGTAVVSGTGVTTITATGGPGGGRAGNDQGQAGSAAGNQTIDGYTAFGGTSAGTNQDGVLPGGGGGSGYPATGRAGAKGKVWFRAKKASSIYVENYATPQLAANIAGGKLLIFPAGRTYTVASLTIPANCYVQGNGSTLKFGNNTTVDSTTSDEILKVNGSGVTIDNLNFDGNSANQSGIWSQYRHCVRIAGPFSNVTVKECDMVNLIGDGVYVSTQTGSNIKVGPNNTFTANYDARNGVSVVTGDTVEVFSNTFTTTTRSGMPGAIDIEPNFDTDHLAHIDVHDNTIVGGSTAGTGMIAGILYVDQQGVGGVGSDIKIRNNNISGTRLTKGVTVFGVDGGPFRNVGLVIDGNNIHNIWADATGVEINYWISADVTNNTLNGMYFGIFNYHACLGSTTGNTFTGVGVNVTQDTPHCS